MPGLVWSQATAPALHSKEKCGSGSQTPTRIFLRSATALVPAQQGIQSPDPALVPAKQGNYAQDKSLRHHPASLVQYTG
jgi:hypothetical protein